MTKQELIDKAVERFNGIWTDKRTILVCAGSSNIMHEPFNYFSYASKGLIPTDENYWFYVCTKEEFQQRAKELGDAYDKGFLKLPENK
jgi:hypothetical protein